MRTHMLTIVVALTQASPALADQTVVYRSDGGRDLVLEIDDGGAVRVAGPGPAEAAIIIDGELFLVGEDNGTPRVVRMTDLAAVMEQAIGPFFKAIFAEMSEQITLGDLVITPRGERSSNGFTGRAYSVVGLDDTRPESAVTWIASDDPALRATGHALKSFIDLTLVMAAPFLGKSVEAMLAENRQLFALGTPLDAGGKFVLASVTDGAVDDARFRLPAAPISREALIAEMQAKAAPAE